MKNIILETEFINNAIKKLAEASNLQEIADRLGLKKIKVYNDEKMLYFCHVWFQFTIAISKDTKKYEISGITNQDHLNYAKKIINLQQLISHLLLKISTKI
jgi:hypothetical protein